jgi:hypothetical protein
MIRGRRPLSAFSLDILSVISYEEIHNIWYARFRPSLTLVIQRGAPMRIRLSLLVALVIISLFAALIILLTGSVAYATPIGGLSFNLGGPGPGVSISSGVGFIQRDVHVILDDNIVTEADSSRFLVKLDVAPMQYLDIFGIIGAANFKLARFNSSYPAYRGDLVTCYGGGLRPQIFPLWFYKTNFSVDADLQYLAFTTEDQIDGKTVEARYQEGQASLLVSYRMKGIVPYGGFKYNPINIDITGTKNDLKGDMDVGIFIGADYFVTPSVYFTAELSIFSETSFFLMVGYNYPPKN